MTDFLPPDADAGPEPRPDVPPPDEVTAGSRPDPVSAATHTGPDPLRNNSPAGEPGAEAPGTVPTEPVVPTRTRPWPPRRMPLVALGYLAAAVVGALLLGGSLVAVGGVGRAVPSPSPDADAAPERRERTVARTSAAPVTIEIWADYQCPFCRLEAMVFGGSMERAYVLPGTARIVYHDFAFLGQESIDAAVAARCAGRQDPGAYWRYHDLLFASQQGENQGAFSRANLVTLAGIASLDATAFTACLDNPAIAKAVADETAQGRALGIASTPTLRITGPAGTRMLTGFSQSWAAIRDAVAAVESAPASASPGTGGSRAPASSGAPAATP